MLRSCSPRLKRWPAQWIAGCLLTLVVPSCAFAQAKEARRVAVPYAPHVRIDWSNRRVEVDGEVVLREGALELFACSPQTREHESIVAVFARPMSIFEAMGLLGAKPGHPVRYDEKNKSWQPAAGEAVRIDVRWTRNQRTQIADIGTWMQSIATGKDVTPGVWRFAGSIRAEDGTYLADADGTVICVVDFPSALFALSELKSADNDALWVRARTEAIPPIGTPVTLVFSALGPVTFEVQVRRDGSIVYDGQRLTIKKLVQRLRRFEGDHRSTRVVIRTEETKPPPLADRVGEAVRGAVRPGTAVEVLPIAAKVDHSPSRSHSEKR